MHTIEICSLYLHDSTDNKDENDFFLARNKTGNIMKFLIIILSPTTWNIFIWLMVDHRFRITLYLIDKSFSRPILFLISNDINT